MNAISAILDWLRAPLWEGGLNILTVAVAVLALALIVALILILTSRARAKKRAAQQTLRPQTVDPITTGSPDIAATERRLDWHIANLQGMGQRESQQDAFAVSPLADAEANGLLLVLCDGMGGMLDGREIAQSTVNALMESFSAGGAEDFTKTIRRINAATYDEHKATGGTTLVLCHIRGDLLDFYCAGDSDLYLMRGGELTALNIRHEYIYDLLKLVALGKYDSNSAYADPQQGALSSYIGIEPQRLRIERTHTPIRLLPGDRLLLCSDGVSDTLSPSELCDALKLDAQEACSKLESAILGRGMKFQDNYTAIIAQCTAK